MNKGLSIHGLLCSEFVELTLKTDRYDGNSKRFEHGDRREMQLVVSALRGVRKRIVEVAQTHKPLFAEELFLTSKEVCERLHIGPRTLQDYCDRKIIPYTQFAGKIPYKATDLERMLEENYK